MYRAAAFRDPKSYLSVKAESCTASSTSRFGFSFQTLLSRGVLFFGQGDGVCYLTIHLNVMLLIGIDNLMKSKILEKIGC